MFKTQDDMKFYDSKLNTPFPEMLNSSGNIRKYDTSVTNTATSKINEQSQNNSGIITFDRKMSAKVRPASVINHFVGRYTPIGKLEMTYDESKDKKKNLKKLKAITEASFKAKSSSMSSNNRRAKKSAGRIERSKQILSRSWERKQSKKKHSEGKKKRNKVIQIIQNQLINLKTPTTTELVFNWPMKATHTTKNEFVKRSTNDSRMGFNKERQSSLESTKTKITKIYDSSHNSK